MATSESSTFQSTCKSIRGRCSDCLRMTVEALGYDWDEWSARAAKQYSRNYYQADTEAAKQYQKEYRKTNASIVKHRQKVYYQKNAEKLKQWQGVYQKAHAGRIKERERVHRQANRERIRKRFNRWYKDNLEREKGKGRAYRQVNAERIKQYHHAYYRANIENKRQKGRAYRQANPEKSQQYSKTRRARKLAVSINDFTAAQWQEMKAHYGYRCVYCGKKPKILSQDHITPLIKGGNHTYSNIVPSCRSCNSRKSSGPPLVPVQPMLICY